MCWVVAMDLVTPIMLMLNNPCGSPLLVGLITAPWWLSLVPVVACLEPEDDAAPCMVVSNYDICLTL